MAFPFTPYPSPFPMPSPGVGPGPYPMPTGPPGGPPASAPPGMPAGANPVVWADINRQLSPGGGGLSGSLAAAHQSLLDMLHTAQSPQAHSDAATILAALAKWRTNHAPGLSPPSYAAPNTSAMLNPAVASQALSMFTNPPPPPPGPPVVVPPHPGTFTHYPGQALPWPMPTVPPAVLAALGGYGSPGTY